MPRSELATVGIHSKEQSVENVLADNLHSRHRMPEINLFIALMEDALVRSVKLIQLPTEKLFPSKKQELAELRAWVDEEGTRVRPGSFVFCCEVTGIDEDFLRGLFRGVFDRDESILDSLRIRVLSKNNAAMNRNSVYQ